MRGRATGSDPDVLMDTEHYGRGTTYNYSGIREYLGYYYDVGHIDGALSSEALREIDVLILKTPTEAFTDAEVASLVEYVEGGGGLLLVGDHTNVFGTSTYLNSVSAAFGVRFRSDSTYDLATGGLSLYEPPRRPHAALGEPSQFLFATSCSLECDGWPEPVQVGYGLSSFPADYTQTSFFPERGRYRVPQFGLFYQSVAVRRGSGRVVAFTDSTVWSNFWTFVPGKPELMFGFVDWLNRENTIVGGRWWAVVLGLLLLIVALGLPGLRGPRMVLVLSGGLLSALVLAGWIRGTSYGHEREPRRPVPIVAFPIEGHDFSLPITTLTGNTRPSYLTFFYWPNRVRAIPSGGPNIGGSGQP